MDSRTFPTATALFAGTVNRTGLASVREDYHPSGTTRMSLDERTGVVDVNLAVHGTPNLYVCGSSVFPTAGYANPTQTICALALRLADHLTAHRAQTSPRATTGSVGS